APLNKVPADVQTQLAAEGVTVEDYDAYQPTLTHILTQNGRKKVLIDTGAVTLGTKALVESLADGVEGDHPVTWQKAIKNDTEIQGMLKANFKASRAIIRHLSAMDKAFAAGQVL